MLRREPDAVKLVLIQRDDRCILPLLLLEIVVDRGADDLRIALRQIALLELALEIELLAQQRIECPQERTDAVAVRIRAECLTRPVSLEAVIDAERREPVIAVLLQGAEQEDGPLEHDIFLAALFAEQIGRKRCVFHFGVVHQHHRIDRFQQIGDLFRLREIELGILDVILREPVEREQQLLCGMGAVPEDRDLRRLPRIVKAVGDVVKCGKIRHPAQQ